MYITVLQRLAEKICIVVEKFCIVVEKICMVVEKKAVFLLVINCGSTILLRTETV